MAMEITGKVMELLPLRTGMGKNGEWRKQEFVIQTQGQYAKQVCFSLWGDRIDQCNVVEGDEVNVSFDLESRAYNDRWYTEARAWRVVRCTDAPHLPSEEPPNGGTQDETSELPF